MMFIRVHGEGGKGRQASLGCVRTEPGMLQGRYTFMNNTILAAYDRHINTIYRVCYSLTGQLQEAEDAAQTVFVKLMESGKTFADLEHEKAWLIRTARNHCYDLFRKRRREGAVSLNALPLEPLQASQTDHDPTLGTLLDGLPPHERLVLYLYYYEGYKINEIARMLRLNPNTIKTRMRAARGKLKHRIGEDERG